ncbi:MAG: hypothetical protein V4671_28055 [Armatimonadota bacterium]
MKITKMFYKHFTHRGYPVEIKESERGRSQIFESPPTHSPHQQMRKRCFIGGQDATDQMEPRATGVLGDLGETPTLEDWETAARQYIDAVLDSVRIRQL